jgi:spermidine/putrescine transport system substrate-binding protein
MYINFLIKICLLCLCSFVYIANVVADPQTSDAKQKLVFLNWGEYLDPELTEKFEQLHDVELIEFYFESDEGRDQLLAENDAQGYDLIMLNDLNVEVYAKRGWIDPLDKEKIPNLKQIDQYWIDIVPGAEEYVVPYFWGTIGIAYRTDLVKEPITQWKQLLNPAPHLQGQIDMINDGRCLVSAALLSLGYSPNSADVTQINEAKAILLAQKPYVKEYTVLEVGEGSELLSGSVIAAMTYNGDAVSTMDNSDNVEFVVPEEGTVLWIDYLTVAKASQNKDLAHAFINFLNEPENAAQLAEYMFYASPNKGAEKLLTPELLENPLVYPPAELMQKSAPLTPLPPRAIKQINTIAVQVMK